MRNRTITSLLAVVVLASAGAGYFIGVNSAAGRSEATTTVTASLSTLGTNESCSTWPGSSGGIGLQLTNRSIPVANATITAEVIGSCNDAASVLLTQYKVVTDSTGWAYMCADYNGICSITISLAGHQYSQFSVPLFNGGGSIVHYDLSNNSEAVIPVPGTSTTTIT